MYRTCRGHCTTTKNVNNKIILHKKKPGKKSTFTEPANYVIIFMYRTKMPIRFGFMIINLNIYKLFLYMNTLKLNIYL